MFINKGWFGGLNVKVFLGSICSWAIVYLSLSKGVTLSGKIAIFTVITPYIMFIILALRIIFLEGNSKGIAYLFTFEINKLFNLKTWYRALDQNLFQNGIGIGMGICFSSFRSHDQKIWKAATLLV